MCRPDGYADGESLRVIFYQHKRRSTLWGTDVFLFGAQGREREFRSSADLLWSLAGSPVHYGPSKVYINKALRTMPRVVAPIVHNQASSVPNVLDCLYGPALKLCCEAVGTAPISLRVSTPDAAYGTRRAQLA